MAGIKEYRFSPLEDVKNFRPTACNQVQTSKFFIALSIFGERNHLLLKKVSDEFVTKYSKYIFPLYVNIYSHKLIQQRFESILTEMIQSGIKKNTISIIDIATKYYDNVDHCKYLWPYQ